MLHNTPNDSFNPIDKPLHCQVRKHLVILSALTEDCIYAPLRILLWTAGCKGESRGSGDPAQVGRDVTKFL